MDTAKDIFFFIGSVLGMLAFVRATAEVLKARNQRSWEFFRSLITEADLRSLEYQIELARRVDSELLGRLATLTTAIRHDDENIRFGPLLRSRYTNHLRKFVTLYFELREFIQVPWWLPREEADGAETKIDWYFCKKSFFSEEYPEAGDYVEHLKGAAETAAAMRVQYRALSLLSDLDFFEMPFAGQIVGRRSALREAQTWGDDRVSTEGVPNQAAAPGGSAVGERQ